MRASSRSARNFSRSAATSSAVGGASFFGSALGSGWAAASPARRVASAATASRGRGDDMADLGAAGGADGRGHG